MGNYFSKLTAHSLLLLAVIFAPALIAVGATLIFAIVVCLWVYAIVLAMRDLFVVLFGGNP